jgi:cell division septation protein DedD
MIGVISKRSFLMFKLLQHIAQARKIESSDSETEPAPAPKKIVKPVVAVPQSKPVVAAKPVEVKPAKKPTPVTNDGTPKASKPMKPMKDYNAVSTPGLKARLMAALNSDDEEEPQVFYTKVRC